jgi:hypothetical protein
MSRQVKRRSQVTAFRGPRWGISARLVSGCVVNPQNFKYFHRRRLLGRFGNSRRFGNLRAIARAAKLK